MSLHAPLLPATRHMVGTRLLESMKPDATLVNTARGGLVDEDALVDVLRRRPDLFAALDVTDPEPPVRDHPCSRCPTWWSRRTWRAASAPSVAARAG